MMRGIIRWLNSIHAHMLALAFGVIISLTALSYSIMSMTASETVSPVSVYEMVRIAHGQKLVEGKSEFAASRTDTPPSPSGERADLLIAHALARQLGVPAGDVRVTLSKGDRKRADILADELAHYGEQASANVLVFDAFTFAVKAEDGNWQQFRRLPRRTDSIWQRTGQNTLTIGVLLVIPLSMWFAARLTRPIRTFAAAAERLGGGVDQTPVPEDGPTEVRMAARSLNEMQARIAGFIRQRTALVGAIAHDLRTPLSRMHFHIAAAPEPVRRAVEEEIREMEQLVGTVLEFVDNEGRPRLREPLDIALVAEGVVDDFADMGKDVALDHAEPLTLSGDVLLLKRLFANLIDNAVKYGGSARVTVAREGDDAVIDITDSGPGMSDAHIAQAFDPFFRGEPSRNRKTGGVGLGLSIVQTAAAAHLGTVTLSNRPEGGLRARVVLPLRGETSA